MQPLRSLSEHQMQEFQHPFVVRTILDNLMGCGQYLWVCPGGVAMVPDGNPKKLEPMCCTTGKVVQQVVYNNVQEPICRNHSCICPARKLQ